ncbi:hypothetical protein BsWGS_24715 [Bradybaena similaris]
MTVGPLEVLLCVTSAVVVHQCTGITVRCLACSYNFAGDGSTDLQCVIDVFNNTHTSVVACDTGRCNIRATYAQGYSKLSSLSRGCSFAKSDFDECDPPSSTFPTCQIVCSSDQCNRQHGNLWSSYKPHNGVPSTVSCSLHLISASFLILAFKHVIGQW